MIIIAIYLRLFLTLRIKIRNDSLRTGGSEHILSVIFLFLYTLKNKFHSEQLVNRDSALDERKKKSGTRLKEVENVINAFCEPTVRVNCTCNQFKTKIVFKMTP